MPRIAWQSFAIFIAVFGIDQAIKAGILSGWRWESEALSITLAFNKGVAFSMLAFLEGWLKYLQLALLAGIALVLAREKEFWRAHYLPLAILLSAGASNLLDRFVHGGVVDYIYWHYGFEFAIFNFADVMINVAVAIFLYQAFIFKRK